MSPRSLIFGASFVLHVALGVWAGRMDTRPRGENISIAVTESDAKKKDEKPKPPPEPPKIDSKEPKEKATRAAPKAKAALPEAKPAEAPANTQNAALDALPDFGVTLSGGVGPGGIAVPAGNAAGTQVEKKVQPDKPAPRTLAPAETCAEPLVKPKPIRVPQPAYTEDARAAGIEGRVRVEVSVDAEGRVVKARLLSGLGHGLDEAALASARQASFSPATRCGKPVPTTFVIAMRFTS